MTDTYNMMCLSFTAYHITIYNIFQQFVVPNYKGNSTICCPTELLLPTTIYQLTIT